MEKVAKVLIHDQRNKNIERLQMERSSEALEKIFQVKHKEGICHDKDVYCFQMNKCWNKNRNGP